MDTYPFWDLETLDLRRSSRSNKGKAPKRLINTMVTLAFVIFVTPIALSTETTSHCHQDRGVEYENYLERKFDGSNNSTSQLEQICLNSKANNETCTLKEILREPEKLEFVKSIEKKVSFIFNKQI